MKVKICGLSTRESVEAAVASGADYLGFVFFPKSPRNVTPKQAGELAGFVPAGIFKVALVVNADDEQIEAILESFPADILQLHGSESVERVAEIKERFSLPVIKAIGVAEESDLQALDEYSKVVDQLLVDAKPPKGYELPGGNALSFDWNLIADRSWSVPWLLAGGLTPENVATAIELTGATQVDVSSGVESSPGKKDLEKIAAFIKAAKGV